MRCAQLGCRPFSAFIFITGTCWIPVQSCMRSWFSPDPLRMLGHCKEARHLAVIRLHTVAYYKHPRDWLLAWPWHRSFCVIAIRTTQIFCMRWLGALQTSCCWRQGHCNADPDDRSMTVMITDSVRYWHAW
jgi:hypothetical protein